VLVRDVMACHDGRRVRLYVDWSDRWIGWYRGDEDDYFCLVPCLVLRICRRNPVS